MDEADVIVARAFADIAAVSILQHRASIEAQQLNEQLSAALTSRIVVEQAKGVISARASIDPAEAFSRLRAYARDHNRRLADVAQGAWFSRAHVTPCRVACYLGFQWPRLPCNPRSSRVYPAISTAGPSVITGALAPAHGGYGRFGLGRGCSGVYLRCDSWPHFGVV